MFNITLKNLFKRSVVKYLLPGSMAFYGVNYFKPNMVLAEEKSFMNLRQEIDVQYPHIYYNNISVGDYIVHRSENEVLEIITQHKLNLNMYVDSKVMGIRVPLYYMLAVYKPNLFKKLVMNGFEIDTKKSILPHYEEKYEGENPWHTTLLTDADVSVIDLLISLGFKETASINYYFKTERINRLHTLVNKKLIDENKLQKQLTDELFFESLNKLREIYSRFLFYVGPESYLKKVNKNEHGCLMELYQKYGLYDDKKKQEYNKFLNEFNLNNSFLSKFANIFMASKY